MNLNDPAPQPVDSPQQDGKWKDAPAVVRAVRLIAVFVFVMALALLLLMIAAPGSSGEAPESGILMSATVMVVAGLYVYGLTKGIHWLWNVQLVLSTLSLCYYILELFVRITIPSQETTAYQTGGIFGLAFGIILQGAILYYWVQTDTREWFIR